jgi:hypothetical protein
MLLRRVPSFRTSAKGRSWGRRLGIGVGAVVAVPTTVYLVLCTESHKNGVTIKPGVFYKDGLPLFARPWQAPLDAQPLGP